MSRVGRWLRQGVLLTPLGGFDSCTRYEVFQDRPTLLRPLPTQSYQ